MPLFRVRRAFILGVALACFSWSGAPESAGQPEPPAQGPWLRLEPGVERTTVRTLPQPEADTTALVRDAYGKLPLSFERNRGQTDPQVKFLSRGPGYTLFLTATEAVLVLQHPATAAGDRRVGEAERNRDAPRTRTAAAAPQRTALRMRVAGANPRAAVGGRKELPGKVNYFRGNDPTRWRTGIPTYAKVSYEGVYPGIDLVYYGNQRQLEYDFIVGPGADPGAIALTFDGADSLQVDGEGNLILLTGAGRLTQQAPRVYQEIEGVKRHVPGRYAVRSAGAIGPRSLSRVVASDRPVVRFDVGHYDRSRPLVIDPVLVYSTYLGGFSGDYGDYGTGIAVDSAGSAYVTGLTTSSDFPTTAGAFGTTLGGSNDAFVTKVDATGTALVYSTFLGGAGGDEGRGIAVDSAGSAYVTGSTQSSDFPTTPGAFDATFGGVSDAFVTKLQPSGAALAYSSYLGGSSITDGYGIAVDGAGSAYVTGRTQSSNFPTTPGAFDTTFGGMSDAFVTKLQASGAALAYSSYLGGSGGDDGYGIAVDGGGRASVTGRTQSSNFPTTPGAFDTTRGGLSDAFVTTLEVGGAALIYSTYLGGSSDEYGFGIGVDSAGVAYVTGRTLSSDFPLTPGAFDTTLGGASDAFVTTLGASGATLVYSTYLGGAGDDDGHGIAVDYAGSAYVTGLTTSGDFPTTPGAFDTTFGGGEWDAFVAKIGDPGPSEPDLVETALSNPPAVVGLKEKFAVTDSAHNQGAAAGATTTRYYLSLDTVRNAGDKLLTGKRAVPALAADTSSTGTTSVTVATSTKVGVYYLLACADDLNVEVETDEGNNCRASTTTVAVRAPDLVETAVSNPPATASLGGSFSVTDTARNAGNAPAGASTTRYYLSLDTKKSASDPLLTGARAVPALGVGASSTGSVTVTIPTTVTPATYYVVACADDVKKVAESNEKNNCRASATQVTVSP